MKRFHLKQNKILFIQTIVFVLLILIFCLLIFYSILFSVFNDYRRQNYNEQHLVEIYEKDRDKFNNIVLLINNYNIKIISHGLMIDKTENYFYLDTLYYQCNANLDKKNLNVISSNAYDIFDNYDFDVIENENGIITFSYFSANIELVYDNSCDELSYRNYCKQIDNNWFINIF